MSRCRGIGEGVDKMAVRKAKITDLDDVVKIYGLIHSEEESGMVSIGWDRSVYPVRETAEEALRREDLYVMEDDRVIVGSAIINQIQVPEYALAAWDHKVDNAHVMVLHTLTVDPTKCQKGYGRAFVSYYEKYAADHGCPELRLDTNEINTRARKMYQNLGYKEVGIVQCIFNGLPDVNLVCLEKYIK